MFVPHSQACNYKQILLCSAQRRFRHLHTGDSHMDQDLHRKLDKNKYFKIIWKFLSMGLETVRPLIFNNKDSQNKLSANKWHYKSLINTETLWNHKFQCLQNCNSRSKVDMKFSCAWSNNANIVCYIACYKNMTNQIIHEKKSLILKEN